MGLYLGGTKVSIKEGEALAKSPKHEKVGFFRVRRHDDRNVPRASLDNFPRGGGRQKLPPLDAFVRNRGASMESRE